jgi:hypothetical protein
MEQTALFKRPSRIRRVYVCFFLLENWLFQQAGAFTPIVRARIASQRQLENFSKRTLQKMFKMRSVGKLSLQAGFHQKLFLYFISIQMSFKLPPPRQMSPSQIISSSHFENIIAQ